MQSINWLFSWNPSSRWKLGATPPELPALQTDPFWQEFDRKTSRNHQNQIGRDCKRPLDNVSYGKNGPVCKQMLKSTSIISTVLQGSVFRSQPCSCDPRMVANSNQAEKNSKHSSNCPLGCRCNCCKAFRRNPSRKAFLGGNLRTE